LQLIDRARSARDAALAALFSLQKPDGHWCAELEGDSILNREYLLMKAILGQAGLPEQDGSSQQTRDIGNRSLIDIVANLSPVGGVSETLFCDDEGRGDTEKKLHKRLCVYLRRLQRSDGSWGQYPGAPVDVSATVKAYFALKLNGDDPAAPHMARARDVVLSLGGAERCNTYSIFFLACLGQVGWDACPAVPPEIVLLPRVSPFHMDKVSAWTRTMILPLALCTALRPVRRLPAPLGIDELFVDHAARDRLERDRDPGLLSLQNFFLRADAAIKTLHKAGGAVRVRAKAIRESERWILERATAESTDGLGAIFPPMVYVQIALKALGHARDSEARQIAERELNRFIIDEPSPAGSGRTSALLPLASPNEHHPSFPDGDGGITHARIQPCFSPVWDTGIALYAATEAGRTATDDARVARCCDWLEDKQVRIVGDWVRNLRDEDREAIEASGADITTRDWTAWAFEYRNDWYPDVDDTAMVAKALWRAGERALPRKAVRWILAMQNDDGGWAAFDRTKDRAWMEKVPFADHNAMQDPSCSDITGRTIEALVTCGVPREHPAIHAAVEYLLATQRPAGWWWGRWGVNAIYGTWQAVGGLVYAGLAPNNAALVRALAWLRSVQNKDGGFGESANSYLDESLVGQGPSTASQTGWALATLLHLTSPADPAVEAAARYLVDTQLQHAAKADPPMYLHDEPAGSWLEPWFTGTGFPKVFYLRYHLYRLYFPLMALARYVRFAGACAEKTPDPGASQAAKEFLNCTLRQSTPTHAKPQQSQ